MALMQQAPAAIIFVVSKGAVGMGMPPQPRAAAAQAVAEFSARPNRIGRARMFAERSVGLRAASGENILLART